VNTPFNKNFPVKNLGNMLMVILLGPMKEIHRLVVENLLLFWWFRRLLHRKLTENNYSRVTSYVKFIVMIRILVLTFTIFSFFNSAFAELDEALHHSEGLVKAELVVAHSALEADHECESGDCHEEEHCQNFCSGLHNLTSIKHSIKLSNPMYISKTLSWLYSKNYLMPSLDPGLRPPIAA
jgi:hypothetical protein